MKNKIERYADIRDKGKEKGGGGGRKDEKNDDESVLPFFFFDPLLARSQSKQLFSAPATSVLTLLTCTVCQ